MNSRESTFIIKKFDASTVTLEFGAAADNDAIVVDAFNAIEDLKANGELPGGEIIKIYGRASVPVAILLGHALSHLYKAVAVWDPKLQKFVVVIGHSPSYAIGDLLDGDVPF